MSRPNPAKPVYQFKMTIRGSNPVIWRQFTVPASYTLGQLHAIIQTMMDWDNSHLHEFLVGKRRFEQKKFESDSDDSEPDEDYYGYTDENPDADDEDDITLEEIVKRKGSKILYTYDFGDTWEHELVLQEQLPPDTPAPHCLAGKMAAPPEDCGGIYGYEYKLEILKDPNHEEYEDIAEWMGDDYDPKAFSLTEINNRLKNQK